MCLLKTEATMNVFVCKMHAGKKQVANMKFRKTNFIIY